MPYLEVKTGQGLKRLKLSDKAVTIGREPGNTVVLADDKASRKHCVIEPAGGGYRVRDLNSRNGTKLNNIRIDQGALGNGDVVRIGSIEMRFIDPGLHNTQRKRRDTPDFAGAVPQEQLRPTLDLDVGERDEDYERRLREVIEAAPEKPFDEASISLVDCQGRTVHQGAVEGDEGDVHEAVHLYRLLLLACFRSRATDLHVEPRAEGAAIRLRVDGYMVLAAEIGDDLYKRVLGIVKILCQIDTSRKNVVQDGHFCVMVPGRRVDYRVSLTPTMHGQKLVIRVLDVANAPNRLHELGLVPWMYEKLSTITGKDAGFLLACGPTGSGKTTTLYSCLREIDLVQRNAITIEDPVEYYVEGCTQIPIDAQHGKDFAAILRSVLRQDPDVIFVGEIRDLETATVAMQASMTGHLVFSTVHSRDTIGAIFRLLDLGVEPYLVANSVNLVLSQRLVRVLCDFCKRPVRPTPAQNMKMGRSLDGVAQVCVPAGCKRCLRTGFVGRRAIFELLEFTDHLRDVVLKTPTIQAIRQVLGEGLFVSLERFGFQLVAEGVTSIEEVERVAGSE